MQMFAFAPLRVWGRLILENRGVAPKYWGRLAQVLAVSTATLPLRVAETLLHSRKVARTELSEPPLFVLGYARAGTTHLHNLLSKDPALGYLTMFQAIAPKWFLVGRGKIKSVMEEGMGDQTRPMDNVKITLSVPQEEEVALANSTHMSFIHNFTFPRSTRKYFDRYLMLGDGSGLRPRQLRRWERTYLEILKKATIGCGGQRLVLKTPANQARVPTLLRMFPDAKFVHIVRDPLVLHQSILRTYRHIIPMNQMQDVDWDEMDEFIIDAFAATMRQFIEDVRHIPEGNYVEMKFEDLESDPLGELERVYRDLGIPGWGAAKQAVSDYLDTVADYKKNVYKPSREVVDLLRDRWDFAFDHWNYHVPENGSEDAAPDSA